MSLLSAGLTARRRSEHDWLYREQLSQNSEHKRQDIENENLNSMTQKAGQRVGVAGQ
jgi:hypothetical protein